MEILWSRDRCLILSCRTRTYFLKSCMALNTVEKNSAPLSNDLVKLQPTIIVAAPWTKSKQLQHLSILLKVRRPENLSNLKSSGLMATWLPELALLENLRIAFQAADLWRHNTEKGLEFRIYYVKSDADSYWEYFLPPGLSWNVTISGIQYCSRWDENWGNGFGRWAIGYRDLAAIIMQFNQFCGR